MILPVIFWGSFGALAGTYAGFPAVLAVRSRLSADNHKTADMTPSVSIIIAAHNEAASIGSKLDGLRRLDYPADRIEIIVISDGSTDATEKIVAKCEAPGIRLLTQPWLGKAAALETGVSASSGEILVFTDANSLLDRHAIRLLVRHFGDDAVGGVAGNQVYAAGPHEASAPGERAYWSADRALKLLESSAGDCVSATGGLYAIRRELFSDIPIGVTDDFYISTGVIAGGKRLLFDPDARVYERVAKSARREFRRKTRVMTRGLYGVWLRRRLLNPFRYGFYAFQLGWHKVARRLMGLPLAALGASAFLLAPQSPVYAITAAGFGLLLGLGLTGALLPESDSPWARPPGLALYFILVNVAATIAVYNVATGRRIGRWAPTASETTTQPTS